MLTRIPLQRVYSLVFPPLGSNSTNYPFVVTMVTFVLSVVTVVTFVPSVVTVVTFVPSVVTIVMFVLSQVMLDSIIQAGQKMNVTSSVLLTVAYNVKCEKSRAVFDKVLAAYQKKVRPASARN